MPAPDVPTVRTALELARRAPSVHNTQPWRWTFDGRVVHLYADRQRWLPATDPDRRDLLLSCGATLDHAVVAFAAAGWRAQVAELPNPSVPDHVAALTFTPVGPTALMMERARSIPLRHTDRRTFSSWEVPTGLVNALVGRATELGTQLVVLPAGAAHRHVEQAVATAQRLRAGDRRYRDETAGWTGAHLAADAGVPAGALLQAPHRIDNRFPTGDLPDRPGPDHGELLLLATDGDDDRSVLRAGRATAAVLSEAAGIGLATCPLSEALEIDGTRDLLRAQLLQEGHPQLLIRVGWAPGSVPRPAPTGRRPVDEILTVVGESSVE